jgi:hypothetical protein
LIIFGFESTNILWDAMLCIQSTGPYSIKSQQILLFITTAVENSNPEFVFFMQDFKIFLPTINQEVIKLKLKYESTRIMQM